MGKFNLIADIDTITETGLSEKAKLIQKVQYIFAKDLGINASFRALLNFFQGGSGRMEDDQKLRADLRDNGYNLRGGYAENAAFWRAILTPEQYAIVTSRDLSQEDEEYAGYEDEAEVYAGADAGEYSSLANIGAVEDEENTDALEPGSHPLHNREEMKELPQEQPRHKEPGMERVPYEWEEQEHSIPIKEYDYRRWLRALHAEAQERGLNLGNKRVFQDLAYELLDNDPKVDLIGNNETTKRNIVNALWRDLQVVRAQDKVAAARQQIGLEDEEVSQASMNSAAYHEGQAACVDHYKGVVRGMPRNPYARGTRRHGLWEKGFADAEHGVWGSELKQNSKEEEELNASNVPNLRKFLLRWKSGAQEHVSGKDIADAFSRGGYTEDVVGSLSHYEEVK